MKRLTNKKCPNPNCDRGFIKVYDPKTDVYSYDVCRTCGGLGKVTIEWDDGKDQAGL